MIWQVLSSLRSHAHAKTLVSHESLVIKKNKKKEESKRRSSVNLHSMPAPLSAPGRKVGSLFANLDLVLIFFYFHCSASADLEQHQPAEQDVHCTDNGQKEQQFPCLRPSVEWHQRSAETPRGPCQSNFGSQQDCWHCLKLVKNIPCPICTDLIHKYVKYALLVIVLQCDLIRAAKRNHS